MVIYLTHPDHGMKVATAENEAAADEKNGWKRLELNAPVINSSTPKKRGRKAKV